MLRFQAKEQQTLARELDHLRSLPFRERPRSGCHDRYIWHMEVAEASAGELGRL